MLSSAQAMVSAPQKKEPCLAISLVFKLQDLVQTRNLSFSFLVSLQSYCQA